MKTKSQSCIFRSGLLIGALIIGLLFAGYIIVGNMKKSTNEYESIRQLTKQEKALRSSMDSTKNKPYPELNKLFNKWDTIIVKNSEILEHQQISADQNLSIWLAVIAAICTILPVVLGVNQSFSFNNQLEVAKEDIMSKVTEADDKMKELQKQQVAYKLQSFVNTLSLNIKILSDWEELEVSQNPFLTSKPLLDTLLKNIVVYSSKCKEEILPLNEKEVSELSSLDVVTYNNIIKDNALNLLLVLNNLLKKYEVFFDKTNLFELHTLMDDIWYSIEAIIHDKSNKKDVAIYMMAAHKYCVQIRDLFSRQFAKEE